MALQSFSMSADRVMRGRPQPLRDAAGARSRYVEHGGSRSMSSIRNCVLLRNDPVVWIDSRAGAPVL